MAARYGNGILFRLGTGFVPIGGSRTKRAALVLGLNKDFKRWIEKASRSNRSDGHSETVDLVLSLSMSREDHRWQNASLDVNYALLQVKELWRNHYVSRGRQRRLTTISRMGAGLTSIEADVLVIHLRQRGSSYPSNYPVLLEQGAVMLFLDAVLQRVEKRAVLEFLLWETTRQVCPFFLDSPRDHLEHRCYIKTVELFGSAAALVPIVWHEVSAAAVVSAEATFASILAASEDAVYAVGALNMEEANHLTALARRFSQVHLVVTYPEDVRDLLGLNEKLAHVPNMGDVFFQNFLVAQEALWKRKREDPSLPAPQRGRIYYDVGHNKMRLPVDYILPPWFSPHYPTWTRFATIGLSLSLALWEAVAEKRVEDVGDSSRHLIAAWYSRMLLCPSGRQAMGIEDVFLRIAVLVVAEALRRASTSGATTERGRGRTAIFPTHFPDGISDDMKRLLVSLCSSRCGPHCGELCEAVSETQQFESTFRCSEESSSVRGQCLFA
ncbi:hypothetical protein HPB48_003074 [Haemaphysalis longicornis]|uniref:Uncharacterized protein n=1 Tax=Haemaphysalis longicornis TaxID=44386 RepID=A0A9J6FTL6_HAELO|nr:hypothetical protein HPB48_003074 [Haemaphysalis longicornis]